jgi:hypothetical protein
MSRVFNIAVAFVLAVSGVVSAQEMRRSGGGNEMPPYDLGKETKVIGEVTGTETAQMPSGVTFAILNLTINGAPLHLMLGPDEWVRAKGVTFAVGTKVEATGTSDGMHYKGDAAMMARQVRAGARVLELRDAKGLPEWEK